VTEFDQLIAALDAAGLWREITDDKKHACIRALDSGSDVTWAAGGAWRADGEDLADGSVEAWLGRMAVPLLECGLRLRVAIVSGPSGQGSAGYSVSVNGTVVSLYAFSLDEPGVPAVNDPWMDCSIKPAAEVNRLLAAAGSARRVALFWPGGNDGFSVLGEQSVLLRFCEQGSLSGSWECVIPQSSG
jgi:hypothetical protein